MAEAERREAIRRTLLNKTEHIRRERAEQMKAVFPERVDELAVRGGQEYSDLYAIVITRMTPPPDDEEDEEK